jgi:uncharacterized membrane protein YphA (DoxX/SURF4 family)
MPTSTSLKMKSFAPVLLRIGIALVFIWFGTQQFINTGMWVKMIPESVISMTGLTASTLVHFNGAFEIVFALCLLAGFFTRTVALLLGLHMLHITYIVGYGPTGVRDFGLALATISLFLYGVSGWSIDTWLSKRKAQEEIDNEAAL